ncbi:hypothetical protein P9112_009869 [Eukaryota sp. TZLM1-RC]
MHNHHDKPLDHSSPYHDIDSPPLKRCRSVSSSTSCYSFPDLPVDSEVDPISFREPSVQSSLFTCNAPVPETMDLSSHQESLLFPIHRSANHHSLSEVPPNTSNFSMNMTTNHHITQESSSTNSSAGRSADTNFDRSERLVGIKYISCGSFHTLLLTYSGDVYGWGDNDIGQVLSHGPDAIAIPVKLPLSNIVTISAGWNHSLALSSEGSLYGWGRNFSWEINMSRSQLLPITLITIPYNIKEVYVGSCCSFALTQEGKVVKWGHRKSFELIDGLNDIVLISVYHDSLVAIDNNGEFFYYYERVGPYSDQISLTKLPITQYITPNKPSKGSFLVTNDKLLVIDVYGEVWEFSDYSTEDSFKKLTRIRGLNNIVFISGYDDRFSKVNRFYAVDVFDRVFSWQTPYNTLITPYNTLITPYARIIEVSTNIEAISVSSCSVYAYNKNSVWKGNLNVASSILEPFPNTGSEIIGSFQVRKHALKRMYSGLIKLVYWEYLNYLVQFGNHLYVKARFYSKCGISKRVAQFAHEVFKIHPIQNKMFLKDPENLNLNENISDLRLQFSTPFRGSELINTRIKKLDVYYDDDDYDPQLLSFFPNVEVVKFRGRSIFAEWPKINLPQLSTLKCLELNAPFVIEQLPTSLVKLVLKDHIEVSDLSYLTSLNELVMNSFHCFRLSQRLLEGEIPLPQSIVRLKLELSGRKSVNIQLPNLKKMVIHYGVPSNITEQNFPSLVFIDLIGADDFSLSDSPLHPAKLNNQGLIKSINHIKNKSLVELFCFPWWMQFEKYMFL